MSYRDAGAIATDQARDARVARLAAEKLTPAQRAYLHFLITGEMTIGVAWSGNPPVRKALLRRRFIKSNPSGIGHIITDAGREAYDREN